MRMRLLFAACLSFGICGCHTGSHAPEADAAVARDDLASQSDNDTSDNQTDTALPDLPPTCVAGTPCDDGDICTTGEFCQPDGSCAGGQSILPEVDPCSQCSCDRASGKVTCVKARNLGAPCPLPDCCITNATCQPCAEGLPGCNESGLLCQGTQSPCEDGNECTRGRCECEAGTRKCYQDPLDGESCNAAPNDCTAGDTCQGGSCVKGAPLPIDDGNVCTNDFCEKDRVIHKPVAGQCDDGNVCTGPDQCSSITGECIAGPVQICVVKECASSAYCDPEGGCRDVWAPAGVACLSLDRCVLQGACNQDHACAPFQVVDCSDDNPCTADSCDPQTGLCSHPAVSDGTEFPSYDACRGPSRCRDGQLQDGDPVVCPDDANPCTQDTCDSATGRCGIPLANGTEVPDGDACNGTETCLDGRVVPGTALTCADDGNPCTRPTCQDNRCQFVPMEGPCEDTAACTLTACSGGSCVAVGTNVGCYIGGACIDGQAKKAPIGDGSCQVCLGGLQWNQWSVADTGTACDDGNTATVEDRCDASGKCAGHSCAMKLGTDGSSVWFDSAAFWTADGTPLKSLVDAGQLCSILYAVGEPGFSNQEVVVHDTNGDGWIEMPLPALGAGLLPFAGCPTCANGLPLRFTLKRCGAPGGPWDGWMIYGGDGRTCDFLLYGKDDQCNEGYSLAVSWDPVKGYYPSGALATRAGCGGCIPACDGRTCGDDGCGGQCGACDADERCTVGGTCERMTTAMVILPDGGVLRPEQGVAVIDLEEHIVAPTGRVLLPPDVESPRLVTFLSGDKPILIAITHSTFAASPVIDVASSAEAAVFLAVGGFALPKRLAGDFALQLRTVVDMAPLQSAIRDAVLAGESPLATNDAALRTGVTAALETAVGQFNAWLEANPIPMDSTAPMSLGLGTPSVVPNSAQGGFRVTAQAGTDNRIVLTAKNDRVRTGRAIVDRTMPIGQNRLVVSNIPAGQYSMTAAIASIFNASTSPVVPASEVLGTVDTAPGGNTLRVTIVSPSKNSVVPWGSPYYADWEKTYWTFLWEVGVWPLVAYTIGEVAEGDCLANAAWSAYESLTMALEPDTTSIITIGELALDVVTDMNWKACFGGSIVKGALAKSAAMVLMGLAWVEYGTNAIMGVLSAWINAPALVQFTISACQSSCDGVQCGDNGCGQSCPDTCPAGKHCNYTSNSCETTCACTSGACCDGCQFTPANTACGSPQVQYVCSDGTGCGTDVHRETRSQRCTGASETCSGNWSNWAHDGIQAVCGAAQTCVPGQSMCGTCSVCTENWTCTGWTTCACSGTQTRTCTDLAGCGTTASKPAEVRSCSSCGNGQCDCGETSVSCPQDGCPTAAETCNVVDDDLDGVTDDYGSTGMSCMREVWRFSRTGDGRNVRLQWSTDYGTAPATPAGYDPPGTYPGFIVYHTSVPGSTKLYYCVKNTSPYDNYYTTDAGDPRCSGSYTAISADNFIGYVLTSNPGAGTQFANWLYQDHGGIYYNKPIHATGLWVMRYPSTGQHYFCGSNQIGGLIDGGFCCVRGPSADCSGNWCGSQNTTPIGWMFMP